MLPVALSFLSKIKLQHILIILVIGMFLALSYLWNQVTYHKAESLRKEQNYENLRDYDSLKIANLTFRTETEIEDYIESNKDIKELMDKQKAEYDGKIKRLQSIIYQKQTYIDNLKKSTNVSNLVEHIRNDVPATEHWVDSTDCLVVKGNITYENDTLINHVTERRFENDMIITGYLQRSQKSWWTRTFGRRKEAVATVTSNCGETKTIIIDKVKKD